MKPLGIYGNNSLFKRFNGRLGGQIREFGASKFDVATKAPIAVIKLGHTVWEPYDRTA